MSKYAGTILSLMVSISAVANEYPLGDVGIPSNYNDTMVFAPDTLDSTSLPDRFNWADLGMVTPAKNQGSCGSCWAFAVVGALESKLLICGYGNYDLSEQQQVSCNTSMWGCSGGSMSALRFWQNVGPMKEELTGYSASDQPASEIEIYDDLPVRTKGYYTVNTSDINAVKTSLIDDGPSYFRFDVYNDFFTFWSGAAAGTVYYNTSGSYAGGHAVLIIGWDDAKQAWLCKNSWGKNAGPNGDGTFWIAYDNHAANLHFGMANVSVEAPSSIAMYLPMNTFTDGQTPDLKGRNNGIINGAATLVGAVEGNGINFSGSNYIQIPNDSSLNFGKNDFSITTWVRTTQTYGTILDKRQSGSGGYHIMVYGGRPLLQMVDAEGHWSNFWSGTYINDGEWHLVGVSVDRSNSAGGKIYVDGVCVYTFNPTAISGSMNNDSDLLIGKHSSGGAAFEGDLDEFALYSKALSGDDMAKLYWSAGSDLLKNTLTSGLQCIASWDFDNGDACDTSGNGANGNLNGTVSVSRGSAVFNHGSSDYIEIPVAGDIAARIKPPAGGYSTVIMEARVWMDNPAQYYNTFFTDPAYALGAFSLNSSNPRITWKMNSVRSVLGEGGGRWGSGPDLWQNPDIDESAFYWGWELSRPAFDVAGQWVTMKVKYDYSKGVATEYFDEVELDQVALANLGPVMNPSPASAAYLGKDRSNSSYNFDGKIDYLRIYAE